MTYRIKPVGDKLVIKPEETEDVTQGGIILPDAAKERTQRGTVIAVGEGRVLSNGDLLPPRVEAGDYVLFAKYGGSEIKVQGETMIVLAERDVHAVLEPTDA